MAADYIPTTDAGLLAFGGNFSTIITASPLPLGLTAPIAVILAGKQAAYAAAYTLAVDPATRGGASILAKEIARTDLVKYIRLLARTIQGTMTVTDAQRYALGLTVRDISPSPIPAPSSAPDVDIVSVAGRTVKIRLHDSTSPTRRGRPPGVAGASLFSFVGTTPPASLSAWHFEGNTTRTNKLEVLFDAGVPGGATVWFAAFWFNARTQAGPTSTPVSGNIPGGLSASPEAEAA